MYYASKVGKLIFQRWVKKFITVKYVKSFDLINECKIKILKNWRGRFVTVEKIINNCLIKWK